MTSDGEPMINITISRPVSMESQRKNQQQPNRNRVIIRKSLTAVLPQSSVSTQRGHDFPGNSQRGSHGGRRSDDPASGDFSSDFSSNFTDPTETEFQRRTRDLLNDRSFASSSKIAPVQRGETGKKEAEPLPPPKKKKIKPTLSVPTSPGEISGNWQGLKKSLGLKDRPKRPVQVSDVGTADPMVGVDGSADAIAAEPEIPNAVADTFVKTKSFSGLTKTLAMDCEFVGVGPGGRENMLARVTLVNQFGHCVYDKFVKPTELVKDYRTHVSGVRPQDLKKGVDFKAAQKEVAEMLNGRTLVGHAVHHDLEVLLLSHPKGDIRDTSKFKPFRQINKGGTPSLKKLTAKVLGFAVQTGEHDSVQDAQATMRLYTMYKREWESKVSMKGKKLRMMQKKKANPVEQQPAT